MCYPFICRLKAKCKYGTLIVFYFIGASAPTCIFTWFERVCVRMYVWLCSVVFWEYYSVCFQDSSRGLMEQLCWFKGITSLLCQNQLIICFTGTTRLTATPMRVPTNTTHTSADQPNITRWELSCGKLREWKERRRKRDKEKEMGIWEREGDGEREATMEELGARHGEKRWCCRVISD